MPRTNSRKAKQQSEKMEISPELFSELMTLAAKRKGATTVRAPRKKSLYNYHVSKKMAEYKAANPDMPVTQRFKKAVESWKACKADAECLENVPRRLTRTPKTRQRRA